MITIVRFKTVLSTAEHKVKKTKCLLSINNKFVLNFKMIK